MATLHASCVRLHVGTKRVGRACANDTLQGARMPFWFARARNQDCEFKVSRNRTELEPAVCQRLLDRWEAPSPPPWALAHARRCARAALVMPSGTGLALGQLPPRGLPHGRISDRPWRAQIARNRGRAPQQREHAERPPCAALC
jgi:hypothetical protein